MGTLQYGRGGRAGTAVQDPPKQRGKNNPTPKQPKVQKEGSKETWAVCRCHRPPSCKTHAERGTRLEGSKTSGCLGSLKGFGNPSFGATREHQQLAQTLKPCTSNIRKKPQLSITTRRADSTGLLGDCTGLSWVTVPGFWVLDARRMQCQDPLSQTAGSGASYEPQLAVDAICRPTKAPTAQRP